MKESPAGRSGWTHLAWAMWLPGAFAIAVQTCWFMLTRMLVGS